MTVGSVLHSRLRMQELDDEVLAGYCAEGDAAAIRELWSRHFEVAYRYAGLALGTDRSEEILEAVSASVIDALARGGASAPFQHRLFALLTETARERAVPEKSANGDHAPSAPVEQMSDGELAILVAGLDRDQREAVLLRHVVGLSLGDVAAVARRDTAEVERLESQALAALTEGLAG